MSRVGKKPIPLPEGVEVDIKKDRVEVKGPRGTLSLNLHRYARVKEEDGQVLVEVPGQEKRFRAVQGMTRSIISSMIEGVLRGFEKRLEMVGTGYRGAMKGKNIELQLGFSHPVLVEPLEGIELAMEGNTKIIVRGIDKQKVGQMAADIRQIRKPNPYSGKGVRYEGEQVRRKVGKAGAQ